MFKNVCGLCVFHMFVRHRRVEANPSHNKAAASVHAANNLCNTCVYSFFRVFVLTPEKIP